MMSLKAFVTLALFGLLVSAKQNPAVRRMDVEARHRDIALDKRAPVPQGGGLGNIITDPLGNGDGNNNSSTAQTQTTSQQDNNQQTTSTGRGPGDGPTLLPETTTSTTQQVQNTPTTTPTSDPAQATTTTTIPTTTTRATTAAVVGTTQSRLSVDTYGGTTLYANTGALSNLRASQTATDDAAAATSTSGSNSSFMGNKTAVAATFTILGIVAAGALVFVGFWFYKKSNRGKLGEEDMWDEASMKEFHGPPPGTAIVAPPTAVLNDDYVPGLARKNTVLPSQSAGAAGPVTRTKSTTSSGRRDIVPDEEPDEMLALPPVKNYERPRDSAYDIVPAAPPVAAYASQGGYGQGGYGQQYAGYGNAYASSSGAAAASSAAAGPSSFNPPGRRGDHTSFGSGLGNDPFAGTGFTDATRESSFGPGQAGRGAGYNMNAGPGSSSHGHDGQVGMGNQWPQGYNPYHGYAQGSQAPYGGNGYGGYAQ